MTDQYSYVRFRWNAANLNDLEKELAEFLVKKRQMPTSVNDVSPYRRYRNYLIIKSDTLTALLSPFRAILSQREKSPFTTNDTRLREIILKKYPKSTSTFFPWGFSKEPIFEVEANIKDH